MNDARGGFGTLFLLIKPVFIIWVRRTSRNLTKNLETIQKTSQPNKETLALTAQMKSILDA
jgi:hypothetical protein